MEYLISIMNKLLKYIVPLFFLIFTVSAHAAAPIIWYVDIINGPNSGGENNNGCYLTITGQNFGTPTDNLPPATTHVYINSVEVAAYKYLGKMRGRPDAWQLSVQIGAVTSGAITVTTAEGTDTAAETFTVNNGDMFYVATDGNDTSGNGSYSAPYRSVKKALNQVSTTTANSDGGDHIVIRGGTYSLVTDAVANGINHDAWMYITHGIDYGVQYSTTSGRENNHVTVMGYPGEDPIGDYETSSTLRGIRTYSGEQRPYWAFSNITIDLGTAGSYATLWGYCGDCSGDSSTYSASPYARFVNITVTGGMGGCDANGGFNTSSFQSTDNIKIYGLDIGDQDSSAESTCASHMMYVSHRHANADISYCYIHDNIYGGRGALQLAGDGAEAYYTDNVNVNVHHNLFQNLPEAGLLLGRGSYQVNIYDNIFDDMQLITHSGFAAISLRGGGGPAYGDYKFYNNTVYTDVDSSGIIQIGYSPEANEYPNSVIIRNNIIVSKSETTAYYTINHASFDPFTRVTADHNLYYGSTAYNYLTGSPYAPYGVSPAWESDALATDPKFTTIGSDFTLQSDSPAIGSGFDLSAYFTTDFSGVSRGTTFDIGAFEYEGDQEATTPSQSGVTMSGVTIGQ
jgi:hypothetical protein